MTRTVLILGASGGFGRNAAREFEAAGWQVRRFDRKTGDMQRDAQGADVIVNAMNPPAYHDWKRIIPAITRDVLAAAKSSGATVIVPGNVYVYGDQPGPWSAATPHRPVARKGAIRAEMEADYRKAAAEGVQTIILRGGDFIDPENPQTVLNMLVLKGLAKGKISAMAAPAARRAYAYLPDMARAAVALAEKRDSLAAFEDVPFPGLTFSMDELKARLEAQTGGKLKMTRFPWGAMRLAGPFWELARELTEMRYLYETPHALSGEKFTRLLPDFRITPFETVVAREVAALVPASGQGKLHPDQSVA